MFGWRVRIDDDLIAEGTSWTSGSCTHRGPRRLIGRRYKFRIELLSLPGGTTKVPKMDNGVDEPEPDHYRARHVANPDRICAIECTGQIKGGNDLSRRRLIGTSRVFSQHVGILAGSWRYWLTPGHRSESPVAADHVVEKAPHVPIRAGCGERKLFGRDVLNASRS